MSILTRCSNQTLSALSQPSSNYVCQREYIKFYKHLFIYSIIYVRYRAWVPTGTTVPGMVPGTSTTGTMVLKQFYNKHWYLNNFITN